jgi:hypothetical protein
MALQAMVAFKRISAGIVAGVLAGGLFTVTVASRERPAARPAQTAADCPQPAPSALPAKWNGVPPDPTRCMTDAEKDAYFRAHSDRFWAEYGAWLANLDLSHIDLHALPRGGSTADFFLPRQLRTLAAAVGDADLIVLGRVDSVSAGDGLATRFGVDEAIKGDAGPTITVDQPAHLEPVGGDWSKIEIVEPDGMRALLPGDRAVLFLKLESALGRSGHYLIQVWTGWYQIGADGAVQASSANPFGESIQSESVSTFVQQIRLALARQ